ncbi:MAG: RecX family transcriptional regulator [Prevotellaceae bacterium]|nr:RecX family transcriptional regulator [Prevotellaceae bacterium]
MRREYTEKEALSKAAALCSASEQCASQIDAKLEKWGLAPEARARIIARLVSERFIDESRFARAYSLDKFRFSGWGRVKILYCLRHLGINDVDCQTGLSAIPDAEYRRSLSALLAAKSRSVKAASPYEHRAKLLRFASSRGFEAEEILRSLPDLDETL